MLSGIFGITCKGTIAQHNTPQQMVQNTYLKATVSKVKEDNNLKETATTNGPQGTVSQKTQQSVQLLLRGVNRLLEKSRTCEAHRLVYSPYYTTVENLHAVSHFKHDMRRLVYFSILWTFELSQRSYLNG